MDMVVPDIGTEYPSFWETEYECAKSRSNLDDVLHEINRRFISLPEYEVARNNKILTSVVETLIAKMRTKDPLFAGMFRRVFYGGSFYDGLRVGKPIEFDLDLLFDIPVYSQPRLFERDEAPGFVQVNISELDKWLRQPEATPTYDQFRRRFLDDEDFLCADKVRNWMKRIVDKCLLDFSYKFVENDVGTFYISRADGGPALTLRITGTNFQMSVDLVPSFVFGENQWPMRYCRSNPFPSTRPEFFIVPKAPKPFKDCHDPVERYWRLSFQEQERELIKKKERFKSAVKLIKKLRDKHENKCIASYYIKTIFLHLLNEHEASFWNKPLSEIFKTTLKEYRRFIYDGNIRYYWDLRHNMIDDVSNVTLQNMSDRLQNIIIDVERNPHKPETIAKYLLSKKEYNIFMNQTNDGTEDGNIKTNEPFGCVSTTSEPQFLEEAEIFTNQGSGETKEPKSGTNETLKWVGVATIGLAATALAGYLIYSTDRQRNGRNNRR